LVADGEAKLLKKLHPDPYRVLLVNVERIFVPQDSPAFYQFPYLPGGSKYQRNVPPPAEVLFLICCSISRI
jgi:hypothetical protein